MNNNEKAVAVVSVGNLLPPDPYSPPNIRELTLSQEPTASSVVPSYFKRRPHFAYEDDYHYEYDDDPYHRRPNRRSYHHPEPHFEDPDGGYSHGGHCCDLVVDPVIVLTLVGAIVGATYFLNVAITMNITMKRKKRKKRRKRDAAIVDDDVVRGKYTYDIYTVDCP